MKVFVVEQKRTKRKYLVLNNFVVGEKVFYLLKSQNGNLKEIKNNVLTKYYRFVKFVNDEVNVVNQRAE